MLITGLPIIRENRRIEDDSPGVSKAKMGKFTELQCLVLLHRHGNKSGDMEAERKQVRVRR